MKITAAASPSFRIQGVMNRVLIKEYIDHINRALRQIHPDTSIAFTEHELDRNYNPDGDLATFVAVRAIEEAGSKLYGNINT